MLATATPRMAIGAVLSAALAHGTLSFVLWEHGLAPSSTWLPTRWHYLIQALLAVPIYLLQWQVLSRVVAKSLGTTLGRVHPTCGWVLGTCTVGLLVVPDVVLYAAGGIEALRWAAPAVLSLLFFGSWFWLTVRLKKHLPTQRWRATVAASLVGLVAQALVGALVIR